MAANRNRRLQKEIKDIQQDQHAGITVEVLDESSFTILRGGFKGPPDTPYEGGNFDVEIKIPAEYPFQPPKMRLETKTWHPNISSQTGAICLDTLSTAWSPILTLKSALISLQGLLASPEPKDPQDAEVAAMLMTDPQGFANEARHWSQKYAGAPGGPGKEPAEADARRLGATRKEREDAHVRLQLRGYSPALVQRFAGLGFDTHVITQALETVGLSKNDGEDYLLGDTEVDAVTSVLFSDS